MKSFFIISLISAAVFCQAPSVLALSNQGCSMVSAKCQEAIKRNKDKILGRFELNPREAGAVKKDLCDSGCPCDERMLASMIDVGDDDLGDPEYVYFKGIGKAGYLNPGKVEPGRCVNRNDPTSLCASPATKGSCLRYYEDVCKKRSVPGPVTFEPGLACGERKLSKFEEFERDVSNKVIGIGKVFPVIWDLWWGP